MFEINNFYILKEAPPISELNYLKSPRKLLDIKDSKDGKFFKLKFEGCDKFFAWKFHKEVKKSSLKQHFFLQQGKMEL